MAPRERLGNTVLNVLRITPLILFGACSSAPGPISQPMNWSRFTTPYPGPARVIGSTSAGCLAGAASLAPDGPGFQVMRITRRRFYGHPTLINYIQNYGKALVRNKAPLVLVGDLSQAHGGPMLNGHQSHQTGLDVDLWFSNPTQHRLTLDEREQMSAESVTEHFPQKFTHSQLQYLETAAAFPEVDRIFVNPTIKRYLCEQTRKKPMTWLQKIRPWWGHSDHFHVRLKCPADSPECLPNAELASGDGCDATLEWWFTPEAATSPPTEKGRTYPVLPPSCQKLGEF
jgi:penicillin-insensitive murein DD-endopeptidase